MLVVTSKYDGNVNVITVVFLSLQTEGFSLLPQNLIPLPALKALQNTDAGRTAAPKPCNPMTHRQPLKGQWYLKAIRLKHIFYIKT